MDRTNSNMKNLITNEKQSTIKGLISGTLVAYAITCMAFILCGLLLRYTDFDEANIPLFVTITSVVSVMVSGHDAAKSADNKGWMWGLIAGGVYAIILLIIGMGVSESFIFDSRTITLFVLSVAGGGFGGVIGINMRKTKSNKR